MFYVNYISIKLKKITSLWNEKTTNECFLTVYTYNSYTYSLFLNIFTVLKNNFILEKNVKRNSEGTLVELYTKIYNFNSLKIS